METRQAERRKKQYATNESATRRYETSEQQLIGGVVFELRIDGLLRWVRRLFVDERDGYLID